MRSLILILLCCVLTGCTAMQGPQPAPPYVDPFDVPQASPQYPAPGYPDNYPDRCPNCPDGNCPYPQYGEEPADSLGIEVRSDDDAVRLVNTRAAEEVKGDCIDCQESRPRVVVPAPRVPTPTRVYPSVQSPSHSWSNIPLNQGERLLWVGPLVSRPSYSQVTRPSLAMPRPDTSEGTRVGGTFRRDPNERQGAFVCMRCGQPTVGRDWHEVWADDGTPLTCVCERCWASMSPASRESITMQYARRQFGNYISPVVTARIREAANERR
ncbi:hypothetical protein [Novipirellula maiorica]|nr:hypothetical protein [Rhodopirellula maiorica]